jgi:hypothetical protein
MPIDFKVEIARIAYWKQFATDYDKLGAYPRHSPRFGARPDQILAAQEIIGFEFPADYAEFLSLANGWKAFCVLTDLFGTDDFSVGRHVAEMERPELRLFTEKIGLASDTFVVIGASDFDLDVFLLFAPQSKLLPGGVLWFASEEIERYPSFSEFFSAMVNYNARVAQRLAAKSRPPKTEDESEI